MKRCIAKSAIEFIAGLLCKHKSPASSGDRLAIGSSCALISATCVKILNLLDFYAATCELSQFNHVLEIGWTRSFCSGWAEGRVVQQNWNPRRSKCGQTSLIDTPAINPLLSSPGQPRKFQQQLAEKMKIVNIKLLHNRNSNFWLHRKALRLGSDICVNIKKRGDTGLSDLLLVRFETKSSNT